MKLLQIQSRVLAISNIQALFAFYTILNLAASSNGDPKSSFVIQPKPVYYIVKNDAITFQCRAFHVAKLALKCNEEFVQVSRYELTQDLENDTETITINFTKTDLGEDLKNDVAAVSECNCVAWSKSNNWYEFESDTAIIRIAYLKKFFDREPLKLDVEHGNQAEFLCSPPEGEPDPEVYWTKNQKRVDEKDPNYQISNNGRTLLIHQVGFDDQGDYVCVAENMAGHRITNKAPLSVIVKGAWTPWSEWSECSSTCGRGIQSRSRECHFKEPVSFNPKLAPPTRAPPSQSDVCEGDAIQTADCTKMCPQNGGWSEWGSWHACGINCVKYRRRECNNPAPSHGGVPCLGSGLDRANCTGGECNALAVDHISVVPNAGGNGIGNGPRVKEDPSHISLKEIFLYVGLLTIVAVFLAVAMIIVYLLHRRSKFYAGVLSIDERHHHYPTLSYTTDLPMSKCSKGNDSLTNMIDMPYHISHSHLLRHGIYNSSNLPTATLTPSQTSNQISAGNPNSAQNPHNSLLTSVGSGSNVISPSTGNPPSYVSETLSVGGSLGHNHGSLTPTYQYIEEHASLSPGLFGDAQIAIQFPGPPSRENGLDLLGTQMVPLQNLTQVTGSIYTTDPHYAHISESEFNHRSPLNTTSLQNPKMKRTSVHSRFSFDSGHGGDQGSHNSSETDDQSGAWKQTQPQYTSTSILPPSIDLGSVAVGMVGYAGGRLSLPESGISLLVPEGAIAQGTTEELFLASSTDISENPRLINTRDSILSATVFAGPPSVKFLKPVILSFDQAAFKTEIDWTTSLYTQAPNSDWKIGGDRENIVHFDSKSCYVINDHLQFKYCLVGKATSSAIKSCQCVVFGGYLKSPSNYSLRVYILNNNRDALARTMGDEMKMGGFLLNTPLKLPIKFDQGAIKLTLADLCPEWTNRSQDAIEIPLDRLWNDTSGNFHMSFNFEASPLIPSLGLTPISAEVTISQLDHQHKIPFAIKPHEIPACPLLAQNSWIYNTGRVFKLSPFTRSRVAAAVSESWTKLAKAMGIEKSVIDYLKKQTHPADSVLDIWECRTHNEPMDLIKIFKSINRNDLIPLLESEVARSPYGATSPATSPSTSCQLSSTC